MCQLCSLIIGVIVCVGESELTSFSNLSCDHTFHQSEYVAQVGTSFFFSMGVFLFFSFFFFIV